MSSRRCLGENTSPEAPELDLSHLNPLFNNYPLIDNKGDLRGDKGVVVENLIFLYKLLKSN